MKTLTIHDVKPEFFKINFHNYNLTFDDGLYSQYFYWNIFDQIPVKKTFFIATNLIGIDGLGRRKKWKGKMQTFPDCFEALYDYRETRNRENYMRIEELKEIIRYNISDGVEIGAHGHNHIKYYLHSKQMKQDIERMLEWFDKHLCMRPTSYAYPHYEDPYPLTQMLKEYGFTNFYGKERIEIEQEINILSNV
jgi:peptidoglycan/xylan/chitin deacetylase (PgdA/CDA1 family)